MSGNKEKLIPPTAHVVTVILTVAFFLFMHTVLKAHVMGYDPMVVNVIAAFPAFCLSMVFWLAAGLFNVTFFDQKKNKR